MTKARLKDFAAKRARACLDRATELTYDNARLILEGGKPATDSLLFRLNELHRTFALSRYEIYKSLILKL